MEKYEVIERIGKGSFGEVSRISRKADGKELVWKEISFAKMNEKEKAQLVAEVNILREMKHPNIVRYYDRIIDKKNSTIYIVMEFCAGGDLGAIIKRNRRNNDYFNEELIWKILMQVCVALLACHEREAGKIIHRDIKPGNIFLDEGLNVKLGDFGLSKIMGEDSVYAYTHVGTPYYMSPEQISESRYNEKSDIWSVGCLIYEAAALHPPFQARSHLELARKIQEGRAERIPFRYSEELQNTISEMLSLNQQTRPSVQDILQKPLIALRLKEKQLKEVAANLKKQEEVLKEKEEKSSQQKEALKKREGEIEVKERKIKEARQIAEKENIGVEEPKRFKNFESFLEEGFEKVNRAETNIKKHEKGSPRKINTIQREKTTATNFSPRRALADLKPRDNNISPFEKEERTRLRSNEKPEEDFSRKSPLLRNEVCLRPNSRTRTYLMGESPKNRIEGISRNSPVRKPIEILRENQKEAEKDYFSFENILKRYDSNQREGRRPARDTTPNSRPPRRDSRGNF
ncbi:unnamed protein product [Blepharisma stoltei]|uniref:non-specific serine/threonine protein kinase n=1 Tax=Blepharisma stoltei TaxID=1481888 RepID=A0AAU9JAN8_9CILI|nr:unnamed protein product [Blepharisma stoltei]